MASLILRCALSLLLLSGLAGCDLFHNEAPSTFEATYGGARAGTLAGTVHAQSFRYTGLGTSDMYQIRLTAPAADGRPVAGSIVFGMGGLERPAGTYDLGFHGGRRASAWITVGGGVGGFDRSYYATAGTLRIERAEGNRVRGVFRVTDSFLWGFLPEDTVDPSEPDSVVFEGRFDAVLRE